MIKASLQIGDPRLRIKSKNVKFTDFSSKKVQALITNLIDSMRHNELVGMAAPQIGVNLNVFVSEIRSTKFRKQKISDKVRVFINPKLIFLSKKQKDMYEGCGSVDYGNIHGPVKRHTKVKIKAYDQNGKQFNLEAKDLLAEILQHEDDHLQGILCIDKFTDTRKIYHRINRPK